MFCLVALLAPLVALKAEKISTQRGYDEFGRACALRLAPELAVEIEGEWYARPRHQSFAPTPGGDARSGRLGATVSAADGTPAELEANLRAGRGTDFTLALPSATGYVHACRLDP